MPNSRGPVWPWACPTGSSRAAPQSLCGPASLRCGNSGLSPTQQPHARPRSFSIASPSAVIATECGGRPPARSQPEKEASITAALRRSGSGGSPRSATLTKKGCRRPAVARCTAWSTSSTNGCASSRVLITRPAPPVRSGRDGFPYRLFINHHRSRLLNSPSRAEEASSASKNSSHPSSPRWGSTSNAREQAERANNRPSS